MVVIGKTGKDPFVGFVLASGSLPYRKMEKSKDGKAKVYVLPREGHESDNVTHPDVDNYACIIGQSIPKIRQIPSGIDNINLQKILTSARKQTIVVFNGHMCKRCMANIEDGMSPFVALDHTLCEFRGMKKDARTGGVLYIDEGIEGGFLGINDIDRMEKRVKYCELQENSCTGVCAADTSLEIKASIPAFSSAQDLARFVSVDMVPGIEKVLAGGVCVVRGKDFETGVYNTPNETIDMWAKK